MAASYGQPAIGIMTGAWTADLAQRLTDTEVTVATDNDEQGHRFAQQIMEALPQAKRWIPEKGKDLSEHVQACTGLVL
jgi:5S rRNA maturation endonuclease (ribonuclease M5)